MSVNKTVALLCIMVLLALIAINVGVAIIYDSCAFVHNDYSTVSVRTIDYYDSMPTEKLYSDLRQWAQDNEAIILMYGRSAVYFCYLDGGSFLPDGVPEKETVYVKDDPIVWDSCVDNDEVILFGEGEYTIVPFDPAKLSSAFQSAEVLSPIEWNRSCYGSYQTNGDPRTLAEVFTANGVPCTILYDAIHTGLSVFITAVIGKDPLVLSVLFLLVALFSCLIYAMFLICEKKAETIRIHRMFGQTQSDALWKCIGQVLLLAAVAFIVSCVILSYCLNLYYRSLILRILLSSTSILGVVSAIAGCICLTCTQRRLTKR